MALRKIQFAKARAEGKKQMQIYCRLNCCKTNKSTKKCVRSNHKYYLALFFQNVYKKGCLTVGYINKQIVIFVICIHKWKTNDQSARVFLCALTMQFPLAGKLSFPR